MKYAVLIKVSKVEISFLYKLENGKPSPLLFDDKLKIPFAFYSHADGQQVSNYTREVEDRLTYFLKHIINSEDSIVTQRQNFPLLFWFDNDFSKDEKEKVLSLFREQGYENINEIEYEKVLFEILDAKNIVPKKSKILLLNSIQDNLYVNYYNSEYQINAQTIINGMGYDPRYKLLAEEILKVIQVKNPHIRFNEAIEMPYLFKEAKRVIEKNMQMYYGEIELSIQKYEYNNIFARKIKDKLVSFFGNLLSELEQFVKKQKVSPVDMYVIFKEPAYTADFSKTLISKFPKTVCLNKKIEDETIAFLFEVTQKKEVTKQAIEEKIKQEKPVEVQRSEPKHFVSNEINACIELKDGTIFGKTKGDYTHIFGKYPGISREHARVQKNKEGIWEIVDTGSNGEGSANGTFINDVKLPINIPIPFKIGDVIRFSFQFNDNKGQICYPIIFTVE